jgi:16S rRNA G966 N2-methylase RsmD
MSDYEDPRDIYRKLSKSEIFDNHIPQSPIGLNYLDNVFPHRYLAKCENFPSLHDAFYNDDLMKRTINYVIETGRHPTKDLILRNLKFNIKMPSHFFPESAAALCKHFAPRGIVYDVFTGWGGRALGAICAGSSYLVSTDIQVESIYSGCAMSRDFRELSTTRCEFIHTNFVNYMNSTGRKFDAIIASPPFLDTEDYGEHKQRNIRQWVSDFMIPMVTESTRILTKHGHVIIHGQDRPKVPILSLIYTAFSCGGYKLRSDLRYGRKPGQSILIWSKS